MLARLTSLLAPPLCVACGAHPGASEPLCSSCRSGLRWLGHDAGFAGPPSGWAPLAYEGAAGALVRALKFGGAWRVAETMAAQMAANAPPWAVGDAAAIVPVPPVTGRARRRGFDPASLLAAGLTPRLAEAPDVDATPERDREQDRRVERPLDDGVGHRACVTALSRIARSIVAAVTPL